MDQDRFYIKENVIIRKENFGAIILLKNGKRYNVSLENYEILKKCVGNNIEEIAQKLNIDIDRVSNFIKSALDKGIITNNDTKKYGKIIEVDYTIENSLIFPRFVSLEITEKCNLKCKHCYTAAGNGKPNSLELDTIYKIIDELSCYGCEFLAIGGGEPLLFNGIDKVIKYAISKGVEIELVSNGILFTHEMIERLYNAGLKYVQISLDGDSPDTYLKIRGDNYFEIVVNNIKNVKEKFNTSISTVLCRYNYDKIFDIIKIANALQVDSYRIMKFIETGRGDDNKDILQINPEEFKKFIDDLKEKRNEFNIPIRIDENMMDNFSRKKIPWLKDGLYGCSAGRSTISIDVKGNVYPCSFLNYDELRCGNVKETSLMEIWKNSNILKEFRNMDELDGKCGKCEYKENCQGGCRASAYAKNKKIKGEDPTCYIK